MAQTSPSRDRPPVLQSRTWCRQGRPGVSGFARPRDRDGVAVAGSGSGTAGTLFSRLEADLDTAIRVGQATFADSAAAGSGAFTGLEAGVAVLALIMAIGSARGLSRRLAEYR